MFFNFLAAATPVVADTTKVHKTFAETVQSLSGISTEELMQSIIRGAVTITVKILIALLIFYAGRWVIRRLRGVFLRMMIRREVDLSARTFLLNLISVSLTLVLAIFIIWFLGIDTTSFVALFASAGLAIGMALSGTLQNFAGGVMILVFKPFRVGDFIEAQGQTGTVKEIQLFNTVLNTPDNKTIMIPNGGTSTGIINNYSRETTRRVDWTFGIAYGDDYDRAKALIGRLLEEDERVMKEPTYFIALSALANSSVNIVVRAWVSTMDYWDVFFDMNEKVYKTFGQEGLSIPFPQMDVHLYHPQKE